MLDFPRSSNSGKGRPGLSAYQQWLAAGNQGTLQDYLNSLKGKGVNSAVVDNNGHLIVTYSDGTTQDAGNVKGKGIAGVNIQDGNLIVNFSDGTNVNAGYVKGNPGTAGKDGINGKDGANGKDGVNGINGNAGTNGISITGTTVNPSGDLIITYSNGTTTNAGHVKGADGQSITGAAGRGITSAAVNASGRLILTYSDSSTVDAGYVIGSPGINGSPGTNGVSPVLSIGTISTLAAGSSASASLGGTSANPTLNLSLPAGNTGLTGPSPNITVGTVSSGTTAAASITGTTPNLTLNLTFPKAQITSGATTVGAGITLLSNATQDITVNFTTAFSDANYQVTYSMIASASLSLLGTTQVLGVVSKSAGACVIRIKNTGLVTANIAGLLIEVIAIKGSAA